MVCSWEAIPSSCLHIGGVTLEQVIQFARIHDVPLFVDASEHQNTLQFTAVDASMAITLLVHARHFLEFVAAVLGLEGALGHLAGVDHLGGNTEGLLDDRVEEGLVLDVVVIIVPASASEDQVALQEQRQHVIEGRLLRKTVHPQMEYLL